jgi:hypothetical protein
MINFANLDLHLDFFFGLNYKLPAPIGVKKSEMLHFLGKCNYSIGKL